MPWIYDPGQNRHKHKWSKEYPGFEVENGLRVGKCPPSVTADVANMLLNSGVGWDNPYLPRPYPHNIYNVHEGAIYKAAITVHGVSYHGFPHEGRIPNEVLIRLRELATEKGCVEGFEEWLTQYIIH